MNIGKPPAQRSPWPWISLLPIGLGAWAPIYAGIKAKVTTWILLGILWSAIVVAGFIDSSTHHGNNDFAGFLLILGWVGAIATSFAIRGSYELRMGSPLLQATQAGELRLQDRQEAMRLAQHNPALAREIGIGRPDKAGAIDAGLVDVNNASVTALLGLPGVTDEVATEIIEMRGKVQGFSTVEDLGATLDLPGDVVEGLRGEVVFLPRRAPGSG